MNKNIRDERLQPILKWAGGKENELKHILPAMPNNFTNYYEPFVGGGAVFFAVQAQKKFINDRSHEIVDLYLAVQKQDDDFFNCVYEIMNHWRRLENISKLNSPFLIKTYKNFSQDDIDTQALKDLIMEFILQHSSEFNGMFKTSFNVNLENFVHEVNKNMISKYNRMKKIEIEKGKLCDGDILDNIEASLKSGFYMHFRHLYNHIGKYGIHHGYATAVFFFIRNYAYSGMFRYNKSGHFNVPYGGIGYNGKTLDAKIDYFKSRDYVKHFSNTNVTSLDFEGFFEQHTPAEDDFVFLDPPYDSDFSTYAKNTFGKEDQKRLADYMINKCKAKWMLIIKYTDFIYDLYSKSDLNIQSFDKKYLVSFMNRNKKDVDHLMIMNY